MKINTIGNSILINNAEKTNVSHKAFENIATKEGHIPIKVSISEEGKEKYKNNFGGKDESFDIMVEQRSELLSGKNMPETDYSFELGNKLATLKEKDVYKSTEDKASDLLKAYASIYDEIVRGYESGTRERYCEDQSSESGYRKLTISDEINSLNSAYKKYADNLEVQVQQAQKIAEAHDKYMEKLSKIGVERAGLATKAQDIYSKVKDEGVMENISEKVVAASKVFVNQYANQSLRSKGIESILGNIEIFKG